MSNEKKTVKTEEVKEEARKLSMEELEKVTGGNTLNRPATPPSPVAESVNAALQTW